jgi:hypothetical protein
VVVNDHGARGVKVDGTVIGETANRRGGDSITAGRDVTKIGTIGNYFAHTTSVLKPLEICFDADDPACIRSAAPNHAEYRVRVHNPKDNGTAHDTHVAIEAVKSLGTIPVSDLQSLINTCLRVVHQPADCGKTTLGPDKREYFLLLEHPFGDTITIYHTNTKLLRSSGWPLQEYSFTLKAHSNENVSASVRCTLTRMSDGQYKLRQV